MQQRCSSAHCSPGACGPRRFPKQPWVLAVGACGYGSATQTPWCGQTLACACPWGWAEHRELEAAMPQGIHCLCTHI